MFIQKPAELKDDKYEHENLGPFYYIPLQPHRCIGEDIKFIKHTLI